MEPLKKKPGRKKQEGPALRELHVKAYRFIQQFVDKKVYAPSQREVAKGIRISFRHISRIISDLCEMGYIEKEPAIKIIKSL